MMYTNSQPTGGYFTSYSSLEPEHGKMNGDTRKPLLYKNLSEQGCCVAQGTFKVVYWIGKQLIIKPLFNILIATLDFSLSLPPTVIILATLRHEKLSPLTPAPNFCICLVSFEILPNFRYYFHYLNLEFSKFLSGDVFL